MFCIVAKNFPRNTFIVTGTHSKLPGDLAELASMRRYMAAKRETVYKVTWAAISVYVQDCSLLNP